MRKVHFPRLCSGLLVLSSTAVYAQWEMVNGADVWARQSHAITAQALSTYPAWQQTENVGSSLTINGAGASQDTLPILLGGQLPSANQLGFAVSKSTDNFSVHLAAHHRANTVRADDDTITLQGSHAAYKLGNWFVGAGKLDWFWGPGWDSSMLLQTPLAAPPAAFIQRVENTPFETKWLSWLGPWTAQGFAGQLEHNRDHANAKLFGARIAFTPINGLEIGLARTAQWGGENRPESLSSLWDLAVGNDNCYTDCAQKEPGNQLAGVDVRYRFAVADAKASVYAHVVGEDEAGLLPSENMFMFGADWTHDSGYANKPLTVFVEVADTMANGMFGKTRRNVSYKHHIYRDGYQYKNYSLGSGYDADSRTAVFGVIGQANDQLYWQARAKFLDINRDGTGRNLISADALQTAGVEIGGEYRMQGVTMSAVISGYDDGRYLGGDHLAAQLGISARFE